MTEIKEPDWSAIETMLLELSAADASDFGRDAVCRQASRLSQWLIYRKPVGMVEVALCQSCAGAKGGCNQCQVPAGRPGFAKEILLGDERFDILHALAIAAVAAVAAAVAAALAPQWQPIESAPKDGTRVLLWDSAGDGRAITGAWRVDSADDHETFTHWQPLPAPPEVDHG